VRRTAGGGPNAVLERIGSSHGHARATRLTWTRHPPREQDRTPHEHGRSHKGRRPTRESCQCHQRATGRDECDAVGGHPEAICGPHLFFARSSMVYASTAISWVADRIASEKRSTHKTAVTREGSTARRAKIPTMSRVWQPRIQVRRRPQRSTAGAHRNLRGPGKSDERQESDVRQADPVNPEEDGKGIFDEAERESFGEVQDRHPVQLCPGRHGSSQSPHRADWVRWSSQTTPLPASYSAGMEPVN